MRIYYDYHTSDSEQFSAHGQGVGSDKLQGIDLNCCRIEQYLEIKSCHDEISRKYSNNCFLQSFLWKVLKAQHVSTINGQLKSVSDFLPTMKEMYSLPQFHFINPVQCTDFDLQHSSNIKAFLSTLGFCQPLWLIPRMKRITVE